MTKISVKSVFPDIIEYLIEFDGFSDYFSSIKFQTPEMVDMKLIKIDKVFNDEIAYISLQNDTQASISNGSTSLLASTHALDLIWLLNKQEGLDFLKGVLNSENDSIYSNSSM